MADTPKTPPPRGSPVAPTGEQESRAAQAHYQRGNQFFAVSAWERALAEWRRASQLWGRGVEPARPAGRRFVQLWAVLAFLLTVLLLYNLIFVLFPREAFDREILLSGRPEIRSWWERWLDTGRPQSGDNHKLTVREWWSRLQQRLRRGDEKKIAERRGVRPPVSERWADLLRRYGRWGLLNTWELDYAVVAGSGLSQLGDYQGAVEVLENGVRNARQPRRLADLYQGLANSHYYQGYHLQPNGLATYDLRQVRKAAKAYENSLTNQPRALSFGNLGWMKFLLGEYDEAEQLSLRALDLNRGLHYVRLNLGLVYLMQGRNWESFEAYRTVIRQNPQPEVYLGGINDLKEILRDRPGRLPFAYLVLGVLSIKHAEYGEAEEALSRFLAAPGQPQHWKSLARELLHGMTTANLER